VGIQSYLTWVTMRVDWSATNLTPVVFGIGSKRGERGWWDDRMMWVYRGWALLTLARCLWPSCLNPGLSPRPLAIPASPPALCPSASISRPISRASSRNRWTFPHFLPLPLASPLRAQPRPSAAPCPRPLFSAMVRPYSSLYPPLLSPSSLIPLSFRRLLRDFLRTSSLSFPILLLPLYHIHDLHQCSRLCTSAPNLCPLGFCPRIYVLKSKHLRQANKLSSSSSSSSNIKSSHKSYLPAPSAKL